MCFKIGSRLARLSEEDKLLNNYVGKVSTELITGEQAGMIKSKVFARLTKRLGTSNLYSQIGVSCGHITPMVGHENRSLRVNDAFYLSNFKGISNIGYFFDKGAKKKGLAGENLGFDRYAMLNLKLA